MWLAEQIAAPVSALADYGTTRGETRSDHRRLAMRHLGLQLFVSRDDMATAIQLAARAAFDTDDGRLILERLIRDLKALRYVLPGASRLERIGLAGRARARRFSTQALNDALDETHKSALTELLRHDATLGQSRLTWLRALPHSTSAASLHGLLDRPVSSDCRRAWVTTSILSD